MGWFDAFRLSDFPLCMPRSLYSVELVTVDENKVIAIEFRNGKRIAYKEENNAEE